MDDPDQEETLLNIPAEPGGFNGDIWYGHPEYHTSGRTGGTVKCGWCCRMSPDTLCLLLAKARNRIEELGRRYGGSMRFTRPYRGTGCQAGDNRHGRSAKGGGRLLEGADRGGIVDT